MRCGARVGAVAHAGASWGHHAWDSIAAEAYLVCKAAWQCRASTMTTHASALPVHPCCVRLRSLLACLDGVVFERICDRVSSSANSPHLACMQIIVAAVGLWYFQEKATAVNLISIGMGLVSGFLFVFARAHG